MVGAVVGVAVYFLLRTLSRNRIATSLATSLFLVKIPRTSQAPAGSAGNSEHADFKAELVHFEQLLGSLASIKKPIVFELAVPHVGEEIHFYLGVPKRSAETAAKQIQGLWSGASVELVQDDFNIFNANGATAAAIIAQKENSALPIKTYAELGVDSFESIIGSFSKINEVGEGAALQMIVMPALSDMKKAVQSYITMLKKGEPAKKVFGKGISVSASDVVEVFNPKTKDEKKEEQVVDDEAIKALQAKIAKPLFRVNVRLVASAGSPFQADDILDGLSAGFNQFSSPMRNEFKIIKQRNPKNLINQFIYRLFDAGSAMTLSAEEIASFYHFPIASTETPHVKWLKSKEAPAPDNVPRNGLEIGESAYRGQSKPIYITDDDRRRHIYVIGQTGTGKSTLLGNLIREDIPGGQGRCHY